MHALIFLKDGRFWPGLGGSDSDYSWVLTSHPLSEIVASVLYGAFIHNLPVSISIISYTILYVAGGIVYALAEHVWMALVGISLHGAATAFNVLTLLTYMGQTGEVMDDMRKKEGKRPLKFLLYCGVTLIFTGGFIIPFGKNFVTISLRLFRNIFLSATNSIMAQFDINPYHWPGWLVAAVTFTVGLLTLVLFRESHSLFNCLRVSRLSCSCALETQLRTKCKISLSAFLVFIH